MRIKVKFDDGTDAEFDVDEIEITGPFTVVAKTEYVTVIVDANGV